MSTERLYALTGTIEPTGLSAGYRFGLLVVAVAMLVLPVLYLGLIALVVWLAWWHLTANLWIITSRGNSVWRLVFYLAPAFAAAVMTFFMVKPVLARPARATDPVPVNPDDEPALFDFIQNICRQVRAPAPSRVQVDCQVNASASFAHFPAPFMKPSLVLTIGLPLVGGFTVRQLAGVVAHEFGHFAQGGGLRLTFIVRSINGWFSRVVYERDEWDEKLSQLSEESSWAAVSLTIWFSRAVVWCSRQILRGLMIVGHGISCFMLRQMEYDADSYEIKLVGTGTFLDTSARLRELNVHAQLGHRDLHDSWIRKTLPSDFPAFLLRQETRVPPEILAEIRKVPTDATGAFDTHPSDQDRAAAATAANAAGILGGGDQTATALFRDFEGLSRRATRHHYEHYLSVDLETMSFVNTEQAVQASQTREKGHRSTHTFYGDSVSLLRPIRITWPVAPVGALPLTAASAAAARDAMTAAVPDVAQSYRLMEALEEARTLAAAAEELLQCGFSRVNASDFKLTDGTMQDAQATSARVVRQQQELLPKLEKFEALAAERLSLGLTLALQMTESASHETHERKQLEIDTLAQQMRALAVVWTDFTELYHLLQVFEHLAGNVENCPNTESAARRAGSLQDRVRAAAVRVCRKPAPNGATIGSLIGIQLSGDSSADPSEILNRALAIRSDVIGRLTAIALGAESAMVSNAN